MKKKDSNPQLSKISLFTGLFVFLLTMQSFAATKTWDGSTNQSWTTANNWTPAGVPVANDDVIINIAANIINVPTISLRSLNISANATIQATVGATITLTGAVPSTVAGVISGQISIIMNGAGGTLTLSGLNSYTGKTTITAGTVSINSIRNAAGGNSSLGNPITTATGTIDIGAAGVLQYTGGVQSTNRIVNLTGDGGTVDASGTGALTLASGVQGATFDLELTGTGQGIVSGAITTTNGTLTKLGTGTWTLSGTNTYTGFTDVSAGTLKLGSAASLPTAGVVTVAGTLDLNGFDETIGSLAGTGTITSSTAGNITLATGGNNGSTTFSGIIQNGTATSLGLAKNGTGTFTLSGANSYTGLTTINVGTLALGATGTGANSPLGTVGAGTVVASGAELDLNGFTLATAEALSLAGTGIASGGALNNSSATAASYSGLITLTATSSIVATGNMSLTNTGTITGATFGLTLSGTGNGSLASVIGTTSGTVTKIGSGTWTLSGANTYTGLTNINAGTLALGATGAGVNSPLGTVGAGTVVATGAELDLNGFTLSTAEALSLAGTGIASGGALNNTSTTGASYSGLITLTAASSIVANGDITLTHTGTITGPAFGLTLGGTGNGSLASIIGTTTGTLTKIGTGTWALSGLSSYSGKTTISAGTLSVNSILNAAGGNSALGHPTTTATATIDISAIGTLRYTGSGNTSNRTINLTGDGGTLDASGSGTLSLNAGISGATFDLELTGTGTGAINGVVNTTNGIVTKTGSGTWTLSATNTFSGGLVVSAGTLVNGSANSFVAGLPVILNGGTFKTGATTGFTEGTGTLDLEDNSTFTFGTGNHTINFNASNGISWASGKTLTITGWGGAYNGTAAPTTSGKLFVGTSATGLTTAQLAQIQFYNGSTYFPAAILSSGEVVATTNFITTGTITGSPFGEGITGVSVPFTYLVPSNFPSSTFTAQLSNAAGSFASPTTLQSVASNGTGSQTISVTIPAGTVAGTGYRIRVISNTPAIVGNDNGTNLTIQNTMDLAGVSAVSTPPVAFSLRKMSSNYTGFAVEVRRSSDNVTANIAFVGTSIVASSPATYTSGPLSGTTTTFSAFFGSSSCYVKTWYDQSGFGRNATQADNTKQPRMVNNGAFELVNNQLSMYFLGSAAQGLATVGFTGFNTGATFNAIAKVNKSVLSYNTFCSKTFNNNEPAPLDFYYDTTQTRCVIVRGNGGVNPPVFSYTNTIAFNQNVPLASWTARGSADSSSFYYNGARIGYDPTPSLFVDKGTSFNIGTRYDGVTTLDGWISEISAFEEITAADLMSIQTNQIPYYNFSPFISVSTVSGTIKACQGTASANPDLQAFTVQGGYLTGDVTVTPPANFEIATTAGGTYTSGALVLSKGIANTVPTTTMYIRSAASAPLGALAGNVSVSTSGVTAQNLAVTGTVNAAPSPITGPSGTFCRNSTVPYSTTTTGGTWSSGTPGIATVNSTTGIVTVVAGAGSSVITYTVTATGCTASKTITTSGTAAAGAALTVGPTSICPTATTTASTTVSGAWSSNNIAVGTVIAGPATSTTVTGVAEGNMLVSWTSVGACTSVRTSAITVKPTPVTPGIIGVTSYVAGNTLALTASSSTPGVTYAWTVPGTATGITGVATAAVGKASLVSADAGTYSVIATLTGCPSASAGVTVSIPGVFTSGTLSAIGTNYGTTSATTSFTVTGQYLTTGVTINAPAGYEISTSPTFASNSGTSITVGGAGTLAATTIYVRIPSTTAAGTYSGNITLASTGATPVTVATVSSIVAKIGLTITASNTSKCFGTILTFAGTEFSIPPSALKNSDAVTSVTFTSTGSGAGATVAGSPYPIVPSAAVGTGLANYNITYTNGVLTVNPTPVVGVGGAMAAICQSGTSAALGGSFSGGATGAIWSDGGAGGTFNNNLGATPNTATYTASASSSSPVTLTLTTSGGSCNTTSANKSITVNPNPTVTITNPTAVCSPTTVDLTAGAVTTGSTGGLTYTYWTDAGATSTLSGPGAVAVSGTYYIKGAGASCSTIKPVTVTVNASPSVSVNAPNPTICTGTSTSITANADAGNAITFSGTNQYVQFASSPLQGATSFTFEAMIYWTATSNWQRIFDIGSSTNVNMFLTPQAATGFPRFAITTSGTGGEQIVNSNTTISTNAWHHIAVTLSGSTATMYIDGVSVGTNTGMTLTPASLGTPTFSYLGKSQYGVDPYYNGSMDEIRFWNVAKTVAEINASKSTTVATNSPNLTAYYRMNEGNGTSLVSVATSGGPVGSTSGGTTWATPSTAPIMATLPVTFSWSPGTGLNATTGATVIASPTNATTSATTATYTVTGSYTNGCSSTATSTITINPVPVVSAQTTTVCTATGFTVTPSGVPAGTLYSWSAPSGTGFTGGASATGQTSITGTLTNSGTTSATATYTVTPISGTCTGATFTVTVTVGPRPTVSAQTTTVCSGVALAAAPSGVPAGTTYTWTAPSMTNVTGGSLQSTGQTTLNQTLTTTTTSAGSAVYTITPTTGSCVGASFTNTVTVNPKATVAAQTTTVCSGVALAAAPSGVPAGTTYTWTAPSMTNVSGGSLQSTGQTSLNQTLTATTSSAGSAVYTITPTTGSCVGSSFTHTVTVNPTPVVSTQNISSCSGVAFLGTPSGLASGTTFTWTAPTMTNVTGGTQQTTPVTAYTQTLTATTTSAGSAVYTVTPTSGSCVGPSFTANITVNPTPIVSAQTATVCSGVALAAAPSGVPAGTTYTWTAPSMTNVTGGSVQSTGQTTLNQTLTATTTSAGSAVYTITPTSGTCVGASFTNTVTVNPKATVAAQTTTVCSGVALAAAPSGVPAGTTYTWTAPSMTNVTGGSVQSTGQTTLNQTLTATTTSAGSAVYTITPTTGSCVGASFTNTVTVNPKATVAAQTTTVCSGVALAAAPSGVPAGTTYTWTAPSMTNVSGGSLQSTGQTSLNQTLTATTASAGSAVYTITPTTGSCVGSSFTNTVTVNPAPAISTSTTASVCSGASPNITLASNIASSFAWTLGTNTGSITGASASSGASINQVLTNPSNITAGGIVYNVVPTANTTSCVGATRVITVTVNVATAVTTHPVASTICNGANTTFTVAAVGAGLTYQWREYGTNLSNTGVFTGTTTATLTITGATASQDNKAYSVYVQGSCGSAVISNDALLTVKQSPIINSHPGSTSACNAGTVNYVVIATGYGLNYQWRANGSNIADDATYSGTNTNTLTLNNVNAGLSGTNYSVVVSNGCGTNATSNNASFNIIPTVTPTISISTVSPTTVCTGTPVTYTATISNGGGTPVYQWKINGNNAGTNASSFTTTLANGDVVSSVLTSNSQCVTSSTATSNNITMTVLTPSVAAAASPSTTSCAGSNVSFTATPVNGGTPSYQWKLNGNNIGGATSSTYATTALVNNDQISVVMTPTGTCTSSVASNNLTMNILALPAITAQPSDVTKCYGDNATFTVGATGAGITYQWKKGASNIGSATSANYTINSITNADVASYSVVVSGTCTPAVTSNTVTLAVGTSNVWNGSTSTDWHTPSNWTCGIMPNTGLDAIIPSSIVLYPVVASNATAIAKNISMASGSSLTLSANSIVNVYGNWSNAGTFYPKAGTVDFKGSSAQTITKSGTSTKENFYNLTLSSGNSLTLASTTDVDVLAGGTVLVSSGTLDINNKAFTLKSWAPYTYGIHKVDSTARLGRVGGTITNSANFAIERYIPTPIETNGRSYSKQRYVCSPLQSVAASQWADSVTIFGGTGATAFRVMSGWNPTLSTLQSYYEPSSVANVNNRFRPVLDKTTIMNVGQAYMLTVGFDGNIAYSKYGYARPYVIMKSKGIPMVGDFSQPLTKSGVDPYGWNLVGNPYPGEIDWDLVWAANSSVISSTVSQYDPQGGTTAGSYYYYNARTGRSIDPRYSIDSAGYLTTTRLNRSVIPSSQGFFVFARNQGNSSMLFKEMQKPATISKVVGNYRIGEAIATVNVGVTNGTVHDNTFVYLDKGANTYGFDYDLDAFKADNTALSISTNSYGRDLAMNGVSPENGVDVPVTVKALLKGTYRLTVRLEDGDLIGSRLYLKDGSTGALTELNAGVQTFSFDVATNSATVKRFSIVSGATGPITTGADAAYSADSEIKIFPNPVVGDKLTIQLPKGNGSSRQVEITDLNGVLVYKMDVQAASANYVVQGLPELLSSGVYTVRVVGEEGVKQQKFVYLK